MPEEMISDTSLINLVLAGPNGIGKTLIAKNLVHQAVLRGATARFLTASELLNSLAEQDSSIGLHRKLRLLARPALLAIDELGYLSYDSRHADLLFEVVSRRYEHKAPTRGPGSAQNRGLAARIPRFWAAVNRAGGGHETRQKIVPRRRRRHRSGAGPAGGACTDAKRSPIPIESGQ